MNTVATNCACCGAMLTDALSQEAGMGPICRGRHGYDERQERTEWAAALTALGSECPAEIYDAAIRARTLRDDSDGLIGARAIANAIVQRLALVRSEMVADSLDLCGCYIAALFALGFRTLADRLARFGLGVEIAVVQTSAIVIERNGKERRRIRCVADEKAIASCRAFYPLTIANGEILAKPSTVPAGDWFVDANSGESVRMAFSGEPARPGLQKVTAWEYFARRLEVA